MWKKGFPGPIAPRGVPRGVPWRAMGGMSGPRQASPRSIIIMYSFHVQMKIIRAAVCSKLALRMLYYRSNLF
jgi:hypothetical protein